MLPRPAMIFVAALITSSAQAAEVSLVSGLFKTQKSEVAGNDSKETMFELGGRYSEELDTQFHWFAQGLLSTRSYSGANAPSDSTGISFGGGLRHYFSRFSDYAVPFVYGIATYRNNEKESDPPSATRLVEYETSGLFYGGVAGLRLNFGTAVFLDIEAEIFESALFATIEQKTTTISPEGQTKTTSEHTRTELYVGRQGALQTVALSLGMKF